MSPIPDKVAKKYIPLWMIATGAILVLTLVAGGAYWQTKHRSQVVEVSQEQIKKVSLAAQQFEEPESNPVLSKNLTILFYYEGYQDPEEAQRFIGLMQAALGTVEPFASADNIKVRTITSANPKCSVKVTVKKLLVCDKSLITDINNLGIDKFKLVVISPEDFVPNAKIARGKNSALYLSTYKGQLTQEELNRFVSRYFMHEMGHALGLRDEYSRQRPQEAIGDEAAATAQSSNIAFRPALPNCAASKEEAKQWWGIYMNARIESVGLFPGCAGRDSYYYPQQETLMSDNPQKETYGIVSEDYIRGTLDCFYGDKTQIAYPSGHLKFPGLNSDCKNFRALYPNFWSE